MSLDSKFPTLKPSPKALEGFRIINREAFFADFEHTTEANVVHTLYRAAKYQNSCGIDPRPLLHHIVKNWREAANSLIVKYHALQFCPTLSQMDWLEDYADAKLFHEFKQQQQKEES